MHKIIAVSDMHGFLPEIAPCDLLIIAGDICPVWDHSIRYQSEWLGTNFVEWLDKVPASQIVATGGNHDFIFQFAKEKVPQHLRWKYLENESFIWNSYQFWFSPYIRHLPRWAFYLTAAEAELYCQNIPEETEILVTHGPPFGCGDKLEDGELVGCEFLRERCLALPNLKYVITGHIHSAFGQYELGKAKVFNVAYLGEDYKPKNKPVELYLKEKHCGE